MANYEDALFGYIVYSPTRTKLATFLYSNDARIFCNHKCGIHEHGIAKEDFIVVNRTITVYAPIQGIEDWERSK